MRRIPTIHSQRGVTLVIGLILLIVLTLMGVSAMNSSSLNLRNVANMQYRQLVLNAVQEASENLLSSYSNFEPTAVATTYATNNLTVNLSKPSCVYSERVYSYDSGGTLCSALNDACGVWENHFDFTADVSDAVTGAQTTVHYGAMRDGGKCSS